MHRANLWAVGLYSQKSALSRYKAIAIKSLNSSDNGIIIEAVGLRSSVVNDINYA